MNNLISKIQYKEFEPGEFIDAQKRNYEETIKIIENFPWEKEREHIVISLTNPSVTIEKENNTYLKLALFFNGKYVLHFFDDSQALYTKSFILLSDNYAYIKKFFADNQFDTSGFRKENTWMQHNLKHFITCDFRYEVTPESAKQYLINKSAFTFIMGILTAILFLFMAIKTASFGFGILSPISFIKCTGFYFIFKLLSLFKR